MLVSIGSNSKGILLLKKLSSGSNPESWRTMISTVKGYFSLNVAMVNYLKVFSREDNTLASGRRITTILLLTFIRPDNYQVENAISASRVISFGLSAPDDLVVQAIFDHTNVSPENFVGYGRHNYHLACLEK